MGPPGHDACDPIPSMASGCLAQMHIPQGPGTLNLRPAVTIVTSGLESPARSGWNPSHFFSSDHTRDTPHPHPPWSSPMAGWGGPRLWRSCGLSPLPHPSPAIRDGVPKSCVSATKWHLSTAANIPRAQRPRKVATNWSLLACPARDTPRQEQAQGLEAEMLRLHLGREFRAVGGWQGHPL